MDVRDVLSVEPVPVAEPLVKPLTEPVFEPRQQALAPVLEREEHGDRLKVSRSVVRRCCTPPPPSPDVPLAHCAPPWRLPPFFFIAEAARASFLRSSSLGQRVRDVKGDAGAVLWVVRLVKNQRRCHRSLMDTVRHYSTVCYSSVIFSA